MEKTKVIQLGVHNLEEIDQGTFVGQALKKLNLTKLRPNAWKSQTITVPFKLAKNSPRNIKRITVYADDSVVSSSGDIMESEGTQETETELEESFTQGTSESNKFGSPNPKRNIEPITRTTTRRPFTSTKLVEVKSTHSSYPERKPKKKVNKAIRTNHSPKRPLPTKLSHDINDQAVLDRKFPQRRPLISDVRPFIKKTQGRPDIKRQALNELSPSKERLQSFISHFNATGRATIQPEKSYKQFKYKDNKRESTLSELEVELMIYETDKAAEQLEFQVDLWNQIEKSNLLVDMNEEIKRTVKNGSILLNVKLAKARELILRHKESLENKEDRKNDVDVSFISMQHGMTQRDFRSVMKMFDSLENSLSKSESSVSTLSKKSFLS